MLEQLQLMGYAIGAERKREVRHALYHGVDAEQLVEDYRERMAAAARQEAADAAVKAFIDHDRRTVTDVAQALQSHLGDIATDGLTILELADIRREWYTANGIPLGIQIMVQRAMAGLERRRGPIRAPSRELVRAG